MIKAVLIATITCIVLVLSIFFFPNIRIKKKLFSTYMIVALVGAICMMIFKVVDYKKLLDSLFSISAVNPIKILILFFSMTLLSIFLDEASLFKYMAYKSVKLAKTNQILLFLVMYAFASILTIFTSNDIVILTFTPFICYFCKNAKINPIPYLVSCFVGANTWSMMFIIGNPTNIYLASSYGITFVEYFKVMIIPTIFSGIIGIIIMLLIFRKPLKEKIDIKEEEYKIKSIPLLIIGLIHLIVCLVFLVISSYINVEMYLISFLCALSLIIINIFYIIFKKGDNLLLKSFKRLPYELIVFILSMFVLVEGLKESGFTLKMYEFFGNTNAILKYGYSSYIICNLINNIPMSVLYANIPYITLGEVYASIIGSNIGAILSPIGALAGIMFTKLVSLYDIKYKFTDFIKYGIIISIPVLTISLYSLMFVI